MDPFNGNDEFETKPDAASGLDYDALCWALVEEEKSLFNKPRKEDFRQRQRRMQAEYTNALGVKYLCFFLLSSLKMREKYISFAQLVLLSLYIF